MTKYEPFKDAFKDCDCKLTQSISRTHIFITQSLFDERLSVAGYSLQLLLITFRRKTLRFQVFFFAYDETVTIPSRLNFDFAIFALHISTMLIVQKEEQFIKSPKFQTNHAHNNKLKSRSF